MLSFFRKRSEASPLLSTEIKDYEAINRNWGRRRSSVKPVIKRPEAKIRSLKDLYRYATACDIILIIFGLLASMINGAGLPVVSVLFGGLANTFMAVDKILKSHPSLGRNRSLEITSASTIVIAPKLATHIWNYTANMTVDDALDSFIGTISTYAIYYVFAGVVIVVSAYVQTSCWMVVGEHQIDAIRKQFFKSILRQEIAWFDEHESGELTSQLSANLDRIKEGIGDKMGLLIQYVSQFFSGFAIAFIYNWKLALVVMCFTPVMAVTIAFMQKLISYSARKEQSLYAVAGAVAEEVLSSVRTVIAFNGQKQECERYEEALDVARRTGIWKAFYTSMSFGALFLIMMVSYSVGFWYGATLIAAGELDGGRVFTVIMAIVAGSQSLGHTSPQLNALASAKAAAGVILDIIDTKPKIDSYSNAGMKLEKPKGQIEFKNVGFSYPSRKEITVMDQASFRVEPGQCVAIVGASGSGKTTIVNLLLRFYDAEFGQVLLDGVDIKRLNLHWLRNVIAVVRQEPILFDATIEENIGFGQLNVSKARLIEAAKVANAHGFISALPEGYGTRVGERGTQLSGGQKQRIAIARALLRNPKVLLLDEATSALDAESEGLVQEALDKARQGHTTIVIAHRLSTVRNADKIIALKDGQVVETGTHDELMCKKGFYYDLVMAQTFENSAEDDDDEACEETDTSCTDDQTKNLHRRTRKRTESALEEPSNPVGASASKSSKASRKPVVNEMNRLLNAAKEEKAELFTWTSIIKLAKPFWWPMLLGCVGAAIRGISLPLFALMYASIFSVYSKEKDEMLTLASYYSASFIVVGVVLCLGDTLNTFANILRQDAAFFDNAAHASGKLCMRLASDTPVIKAVINLRFGSLLMSTVSMISATVIGLIYGWQLTLLMLIILPLFAFSVHVNLKLRERNDNRDILLMEEAAHTASEAIENIRTVQCLTCEMPIFEKFCRSLEKPYREGLRHSQLQAASYAFSQCIVFFVYAASFRFGGYLVVHGDIRPLDIFKVFFVIMICGTTIALATSYFPEVFKARVAAGLVMKLINTTSRIDSGSNGGLRKEFNGDIIFDNVHFSYPSRADAPVLRGMSLCAPFGKTTALVGHSGCGKSTAINLLERFYDPVDGRILIDDNDLRTFNVQFARQQIALVSQEPTLFDCSIAENISYGLDEVSYEELVQAAKTANIHEFVMGLPEGYETRVGEKGVQLSGGQKQRVAIARALVRKPKILLLDEATSALDTENEKVVQEALDKARQGRTCIVVAHRLSTIQGADHIVLFKNGRIVEQGTHAELVAKRGRYYRLTRKQHLH